MKTMIFLLLMSLSIPQGMAASRDALLALIHEREQGLVTQSQPTSNAFFDTHTLVFFFSSTCPHCHEQSPILAQWVKAHGVTVEAFSFDNKPLPEFQHPLPITNALVDVAFAGQPIRYPALFVMNKSTHTLFPVSFGMMQDSELDERFSALIPKISEFEQGRPS